MSARSLAIVTGCAAAAWLVTIASVRAQDATSTRLDDAMTCEQIAMELSAYAQQIVPNIQAMGATQQQLYAQTQQKAQQQRLEAMMLLPLAQASTLDPTGVSKRALQAAVIAQTAKQRADAQVLANSSLAKQYKAQSNEVAAQAQQLQGDARLQRLMQLGQQKHCDRQ